MKFVKKAIALGVAMCLLAGCQSPAKPNGQEQSDSSAASSVSADSEGPKLTTEALEKMPLTGQGTWVDGEDGTKWYKNTGTFYDAFDTMIQFVAYTKDEKEFDRYFTLCRTEFERLHKLYDNYKEYDGVTNLMTLNKTAAQAPVAVEDDLFSMLAFSKENYAKTLGKVNIAMGATLTLWHDTREAAIAEQEEHEHDASHSDATSHAPITLPTKAALEASAKHRNINDLVLDPKKKTVYFKDPDLKLDAGAVAKGYATECIAKKLMEAGFAHGLISAGGNVKVIGTPIDGRATWNVGIMHPRSDNQDIIAKAAVKANTSMVTSGDYQRCFELNGVRYAHIIDPQTLYPATAYSSVTVRTADSGLADLLSTAFFIATPEEAQKILENYKDAGVEVLWVDQNMHVNATPGMQADVTLAQPQQ